MHNRNNMVVHKHENAKVNKIFFSSCKQMRFFFQVLGSWWNFQSTGIQLQIGRVNCSSHRLLHLRSYLE